MDITAIRAHKLQFGWAKTLAGLLFLAAIAPCIQAQSETPDDRFDRLLSNRDQLTITIQLADLDAAVPSSPATPPVTVGRCPAHTR
jgi:hypothetical protein